MKKLITLLMALLCLIGFSTAMAQENFEFQINGGPHLDYPQLIQQLRQQFSANPPPAADATVTITLHLYGQQVNVTLEPRDFYITQVNGQGITPQESDYPESGSDIGYQTIVDAFYQAQNFANLSVEGRQNVVRILAFVIAEAARFETVFDAVNGLFNNPWEGTRINWNGYSREYLHSWGAASETISGYIGNAETPPPEITFQSQTTGFIAGITAALWLFFQAHRRPACGGAACNLAKAS